MSPSLSPSHPSLSFPLSCSLSIAVHDIHVATGFFLVFVSGFGLERGQKGGEKGGGSKTQTKRTLGTTKTTKTTKTKRLIIHSSTYAKLIRHSVTTELDLAMHTASKLPDNHVLVDHLVAGHGIIVFHHGVCLLDRLRRGRDHCSSGR